MKLFCAAGHAFPAALPAGCGACAMLGRPQRAVTLHAWFVGPKCRHAVLPACRGRPRPRRTGQAAAVRQQVRGGRACRRCGSQRQQQQQPGMAPLFSARGPHPGLLPCCSRMMPAPCIDTHRPPSPLPCPADGGQASIWRFIRQSEIGQELDWAGEEEEEAERREARARQQQQKKRKKRDDGGAAAAAPLYRCRAWPAPDVLLAAAPDGTAWR